MRDIEAIKKIANYINVPTGKLSYNTEKVVTRSTPDSTISGFSSILKKISKESGSYVAKSGSESLETQCEIYQWIDYAVLFVAPATKDKHVAQTLLKDLNAYLLTRSYFVGYTLSLADLAVFYAIHDLMKTLSPIDKENLLNLSRWFDHLQKQEDIRQGAELLNFTTIYLHGWATGTHL